MRKTLRFPTDKWTKDTNRIILKTGSIILDKYMGI